MGDGATSRADVIAFARKALLAQAVAFVGGQTADEEQQFLRRVGDVIAGTSEDELFEAVARLESVGNTWGYHPPNAFARRMHDVMGDVAITASSTLTGLEHLEACRSGPLVFLPNHLSYADANLFQILLTRSGWDDLATRLTVVAGPKVYSELFRRFSALSFGTIKTPQPSSRASGAAMMSAREVARLALGTITEAHERVAAGDALLVFAEGTRSRKAALQPLLAAMARYFEYPGLLLVPVGIAGSEHLIPIGASKAQPTRVDVAVGPPIDAATLIRLSGKSKRLAMDVLGVSIARLLPEDYRGAYGADAAGLDEARRVLASL